jgi:flagellar hook assembly protein FlgD
LLVVTWPKSDWDVTVVPNPFTQNDDVIPTKLVQQINIPAGHGTLITANKNAPYDVVQSSGTIAIYDALGNSIVNETMKLVNGVFYYYWNGQNRSMRHVGTGAYLVIVKITEENKQTYVKKIMVGVKR